MSDDFQGFYNFSAHDPSGDPGDLVQSQERTDKYDPYYGKRQRALAYLGDRYLLAKPQNRRPA